MEKNARAMMETEVLCPQDLQPYLAADYLRRHSQRTVLSIEANHRFLSIFSKRSYLGPCLESGLEKPHP